MRRNYEPFYDPNKSYEENLAEGPFSIFADQKIWLDRGKPQYDFLGFKVHAPFGIAAGPLINGKFLKAALDKAFDVVTYKTVRTQKHASHAWPNVLPLEIQGELTLDKAQQGLTVLDHFMAPCSITNSFGVPSADPEFWAQDLAGCVNYAKEGQVVIGAFQGTPASHLEDLKKATRLIKNTGVKILEVNLSCPNEGTANLLCFDVFKSRSVVELIKSEIGALPLIVKIAYFPEDQELVRFVSEVGPWVEAIETINTIPAQIRNQRGEQALPGEGRSRSGVCGHAVKWAGLDMVKRLKALRDQLGLAYQIIGVGGVSDVEDFNSYRIAGADCVLSATGVLWNPCLAREIKKVNAWVHST